MADHDVESRQRFAVRGVDGEPGGVADDVEAGVGGLPLLAEPGPQQAVDLHAAVEFLAEVLTAGVGDAYAQRQFEHGVGAGPVHGADEDVGYQWLAVGAQVVQESGVEEGGDGGALREVAGLPGVQGQRDGTGRAIGGRREPVRQLCGGDGAAAFRPGRVGGQDGGVDGHPVQREGAVQLG